MSRFHQDEHNYERENRSVITRTTDGLIRFWNDSAEKLYGWRKEEALGKVSHDLLQTDFPKPLKEIESELVRNGRWEGVLFHTTRQGDRLAVESRWTLDPALEPGTVVESNMRSTEPGARPDLHPIETRAGEPLKKPSEDEISDKLGGFANFVLGTAALFCLLISTYV
ncbi:MAG TPA: PAS domain-containing protein, partial [Candidatus Binatia bacterium]|nr:PAS domain-containing protein [Candidatus Binatia bacterium]